MDGLRFVTSDASFRSAADMSYSYLQTASPRLMSYTFLVQTVHIRHVKVNSLPIWTSYRMCTLNSLLRVLLLPLSAPCCTPLLET